MSATNDDRPSNRLADSGSPYLLQHRHNPVDWYPWGDEALERARSEQKPIFLSIGYAACHWCHVMERESFEDPAIAALLNEQFVSIKVDREERPDIDEIYMSAVQVITGQGGWPLSVFLTPELKPFFGGTYFPPETRHGRIGFPELLQRIRETWDTRRDEVDSSATSLTETLQTIATAGLAAGATPDIDATMIDAATAARAAAELAGRFDSRWGGFGNAPKFPPDGGLLLLMREHARTGENTPWRMAAATLEAMARGGIYDHVGGGFARYSVDERWLVPHFEKMLYNQALLVPCYVEAWLRDGRPLWQRTVQQTLDFVARELTDPSGGFWSALDADSEGVEGKFYVWTPDEVQAALPPDAAKTIAAIYDVQAGGNFEGKSILNLLSTSLAELADQRGVGEDELFAELAGPLESLRKVRERRVRPGTDDKVLAAWNGLMLGAFAIAARTLGREEDLSAAQAAARFVVSEMIVDGRLRVSWRRGQARLNGYLDDYAFVIRGLIELYEADFDRHWLDVAATLADSMVTHFADDERGGWFFTSDDHEQLLTRTRSGHDGATPSGAGVACEALLRLARHLDRPDLAAIARRALAAYRPTVVRAPGAYVSMLAAAAWAEAPGPLEIAIVGAVEDPATSALLETVRRTVGVHAVVQHAATERDGEWSPLLRGKRPIDRRPTIWVCRDYSCQRPTTEVEDLRALLGEFGGL